MHTALSLVWSELAADDSLHSVVLSGNGRAFCAGGDVKGMGANLVIYVDEELIVATVDNLGALGLGRALEMAEIFRTP